MRNFRLLLLAGVALFIAFKTLPARALLDHPIAVSPVTPADAAETEAITARATVAL